MQKLLLGLLLLPFVGFSQAKKTIVSVDRVFPKADKIKEFEKALATHAQKYHTGNWHWRVLEITTGPDMGGYHITEGPNNWTTIGSRGDISPEHDADWDRSIAPLLTDRGSASYSEYDEELSTVPLTDFVEYITISHIFLKPGMIDKFKEELKKAKKAWTAGNESIAVYSAVASGPPQIAIVTRLKTGLKELEKGFRAPMNERYDTANGAGAWANYLRVFAECVESRWTEMLRTRADLGSK